MRASLIAFLFIAACSAPEATTPPAGEPAPPAVSGPQTAEEATAQDTCGMAAFQHLIGTDASAIDQSTLPAGTRMITPDSMVTQDFSPTRLNILTSTDGKVSSMRCF